MEDYYRILEVPKEATQEEIKSAYRRLSKQYHPDTNKENQEAIGKFHIIVEAYEILSDSQKRRTYDQGQSIQNYQNVKKNTGQRAAEFGRHSMSGAFDHFFGFHPDLGKEKQKTADKNEKTKTNPLDTTDLFERYMGMNGKNK